MAKEIQYKVHILQNTVKEIYVQSTKMKVFAMHEYTKLLHDRININTHHKKLSVMTYASCTSELKQVELLFLR